MPFLRKPHISYVRESPRSRPPTLPRLPIVRFAKPQVEEEGNEGIQEPKNQIRHAMEVLEEGKQVAAFNLLKRIVNG